MRMLLAVTLLSLGAACASEYVPLPQTAASVHETGYSSSTVDCLEVTCNTVGDGGTMTLVANKRYDMQLDEDSAARFHIAGPCNSYATGTGKKVSAGAMFDWTAPKTPDGGVPVVRCCSKTGTTVLQACPAK
jgi:hypothetical protein